MSDLPAFTLPLLASIIAGGVIGFEREWRGRAAGFRTHILVCLSSCLLMEAAVSQGAWRFLPLSGTEIVSDPTRMAHGVLTGIGFLCAGVIFRQGFSVHGLTTAASLWITSALGVLFGVGLYTLGAVGTVLTATILVILRAVSRRMPQTSIIDADIVWRREDPDVQTRIEAILDELDGSRRGGKIELIEGGAAVRRRYRLGLQGEPALRDLSARLQTIEGVTGYSLDPRDD